MRPEPGRTEDYQRTAEGQRPRRPRRDPEEAKRRQLARQRQKRNRIIAGAVIAVVVVAIALIAFRAAAPAPGQAQADPAAAGAPTNTAGAQGDPAATGTGDASTAAADQGGQQPAGAYLGVDDPWVPSGKFTTGDAELDTMLKEYCDANSSPDKTAEENAYSVYLAISWSEVYEQQDDEEMPNQHPQGPDWDILYSKQFLWRGGGNCYEFSAITGFALQYFGYADAHGEPCEILRESGGYGPHGLVVVTNKDGSPCICDNAMGSNGWMLRSDIYTYYIEDIGQGDPVPNTSIGVV